MKHFPWLTFALLVPAALILPAGMANLFEYDRSLVSLPAMYRFLTCQWTHFSIAHFAWDAAVFLVLGLLIEQYSRRALLAIVGISAIAVPLAVHLFCPDIHTFRGLSGIDSALFGFILTRALLQARQDRHRARLVWCIAVLGLFILKTTIETLTQTPVFASGDFVVVPLAHAVGLVVGIFWASSADQATYPKTAPGFHH